MTANQFTCILLSICSMVLPQEALADEPEQKKQEATFPAQPRQIVERLISTEVTVGLAAPEDRELLDTVRKNPSEFVAPLRKILDIWDREHDLADRNAALKCERALQLVEFLGREHGADLALDAYRRASTTAKKLEAKKPIQEQQERGPAGEKKPTSRERAVAQARALRRQSLAILGRFGDVRVIDDVFANVESEDRATFYTMLRYLHDVGPREPQILEKLSERYEDQKSALHSHPAVQRIMEELSRKQQAEQQKEND